MVPGMWLHPDELTSHALVDYERGGIALNDTSEGLLYQDWTLWLRGDDVVIKAENYAPNPPTVLFTFTGITELSLAFDQNMNPFVAYVRDGEPWFWWWDPSPNDYVHVALPVDCLTPRCCMDDKRDNAAGYGFSDVILAYARNDNIYTREQRNRYIDEDLFEANVFARLIKIGMHGGNRLQLLLTDPDTEEVCP